MYQLTNQRDEGLHQGEGLRIQNVSSAKSCASFIKKRYLKLFNGHHLSSLQYKDFRFYLFCFLAHSNCEFRNQSAKFLVQTSLSFRSIVWFTVQSLVQQRWTKRKLIWNLWPGEPWLYPNAATSRWGQIHTRLKSLMKSLNFLKPIPPQTRWLMLCLNSFEVNSSSLKTSWILKSNFIQVSSTVWTRQLSSSKF